MTFTPAPGNFTDLTTIHSGGNAMFTIVPILVFIGFIAILGYILFRALQSGAEWNKNNHSPIETVSAKVVTKRMDVRRRGGMHHGNMHRHTSTTYFVTFEMEGGHRMELKMSGNEYGMLAEGDGGMLTFQGTRYKGFERM